MKRLLLVLLFTTPALGVETTATIPAGPATANGVVQCENIRTRLHFRAAEWTMDHCTTVMAREGVKSETILQAALTHATIVSACVSVANNVSQEALNDFETDWPLPIQPAVCGDGILDTEFGEECDDGNDVEDDGCTFCITD